MNIQAARCPLDLKLEPVDKPPSTTQTGFTERRRGVARQTLEQQDGTSLSAVPLAQRIARWTSNPKVVGSIPTRDALFLHSAAILKVRYQTKAISREIRKDCLAETRRAQGIKHVAMIRHYAGTKNQLAVTFADNASSLPSCPAWCTML
ncbi:hypothetical protein J6590_044789 [Homalodisca vitripennis]|nr:hypothetical protein J6590_044789 [Homalodisca vitripennis]